MIVRGGMTTGAGSDPTTTAAALRDAIARALDDDSEAAANLRHARTTVTFRVRGAEQPTTLQLGPRDIALTADADGEISLELDPATALAFSRGELSMTAAVVAERVGHRGPVRRYLEIDPILRGLLSRHTEAGPVEQGAVEREPSPEILAIETRGLRKKLGTQEVLAGLDVRIPEGVISVVLGPSGTGKSVLLQHVIGLMQPDAGDVYIRGRRLGGMSRSEALALRREIGVMFQDGALFSAMNVYDNVAFPLRQHTDLDEAEVREVATAALASVGLTGAADRMPAELSGGMRKRIGLARALVLNAGIVLCDEPDSGLDPVRTALLGDLLAAQHERHGGTMVVVTHNVMLARLLADHVTIIWRGRVLEEGFAADVFASETPFVQQFLAGETDGPLGMDA